MKVPRILIRGILAGFFVCGGVGAANDDEILRAKLRPCVKDGTTFGDVNSCGKVWKLGSGEAKLEADGKIKVEVKGLVLNDASTGDLKVCRHAAHLRWRTQIRRRHRQVHRHHGK